MDGVCQVVSVGCSLSDERQVEAEHEELDWDSFTTSIPLHQVQHESAMLIMHVHDDASDALITREHGPVYVYIQFTVLLLWVNASAKWIYFSVVICNLALF